MILMVIIIDILVLLGRPKGAIWTIEENNKVYFQWVTTTLWPDPHFYTFG